MGNKEYQEYLDIVEKKYKGAKSIGQRGADKIKKASEALKKLNEAIAECYKKDDSGNYSPVGEERLENIRKLYAETFKRVANARNAESKTDILNAIYVALQKDIQTVNAMNPAETFPEYFRRDVVSFEKFAVKTLGGALSERIPVIYTDDTGKERKGFFTKESLLIARSFWDHLAEVAENEVGKNPRGEFLQALFQSPAFQKRVRKQGLQDFFNEIQSRTATVYDEKYVQQGEAGKMQAEIDVWSQTFAELKLDPELITGESGNQGPSYNEAMNAFLHANCKVSDKDKFADSESYRLRRFGMDRVKEGENITDRNCAMSQVAKLFGKEDLLAGSVPMEIRVGGRKQRGIFMEEAEGLNYEQWAQSAEKNHIDRMKPSAIHELADIQMIDYICANTDRHWANMIYTFDKYGNLEHVRGIDHDMSFGGISHAKKNDKYLSVDNMLIVSKEMADKVKALKREELEHMLSGLDLPDDKKKDAWDRVMYMKQRLERAKEFSDNNTAKDLALGQLYIVPDHLWGKIQPGHLLRGAELAGQPESLCQQFYSVRAKNIFNCCLCSGYLWQTVQQNPKVIRRVSPEFGRLLRGEFQPRKVQEEPREYNRGTYVSPAFSAGALHQNERVIHALMKRLRDTVDSKGLEHRGQAFQDMFHSVENLQEWFTGNKGNEAAPQQKEALQNLYSDTVQKCKNYILGHNPYSSVGKKRQQAAMELMEFISMQGLEVDRDLMQLKEQQMLREQGDNLKENSLLDLGRLSELSELSVEDKKRAMSLMGTVVKQDKELGVSDESIAKRHIWGQGMSPDQLQPKDLQTFLEAEDKCYVQDQLLMYQKQSVEKKVDKPIRSEYNSMVK